jgi:hypothetical protein
LKRKQKQYEQQTLQFRGFHRKCSDLGLDNVDPLLFAKFKSRTRLKKKNIFSCLWSFASKFTVRGKIKNSFETFSQGVKNAEFYVDFKTMEKILPEKRSCQKSERSMQCSLFYS